MTPTKFKDFNDYLEHKFMMDFRGIKDQLPEAFEEWLEDLDTHEWIDLGDSYNEIALLQDETVNQRVQSLIEELEYEQSLRCPEGVGCRDKDHGFCHGIAHAVATLREDEGEKVVETVVSVDKAGLQWDIESKVWLHNGKRLDDTLPLFYVTFGQRHTHRVNGYTLDCDTVAVIKASSQGEARRIAFELFENKWAFLYDSIEELRVEYYDNFVPVN